jgi:O-antigen/teichoic acid export membrane protein
VKVAGSFALVFTGYVLRLSAGMVVFVVLARLLGPAPFGRFSYWLAIATILTIPVNYGFNAMVLRSFGAEPQRAPEIMAEVFAAKLLLAALVIVAALLGLLLVPSAERIIFVALLLAQVSESFSEYYTLGFRVKGHFSRETVTASLVSIWHIAVMTSTGFLFKSVDVAALAFAGSRLASVALTRARALQSFGTIPRASLGRAIATMKAGWAYAAELGLLTIYMQIDSLIINTILGSAAVGIYQAGMKLVLGGFRVAPVLAQVLLPELARSYTSKQNVRAQAFKTMSAFAGIGISGALVMAVGAHFITDVLFGKAFAPLAPLMPWFGLMLFAKFMETGVGLILVAHGLQNTKVWFVVVQLALVLAVGWMATQRFGLIGWQLTNIACIGLLIGLYGWLLKGKSFASMTGSKPVSVDEAV